MDQDDYEMLQRKLGDIAEAISSNTLPPRLAIAAQLLAAAWGSCRTEREWVGAKDEAWTALVVADALLAAHAETEGE